MKPKHYISILIAIIAIFLAIFLSGCTGKTVSGIRMKNEDIVEVKSGNIDLDNISVIVIYSNGETKEIALTEDMIPEAEKLNFYKMGEHDVKVTYGNRFSTTMKINVVRHDFDDIYKLEDKTVTYDGNPHKIEINYELPEGATVEYLYGNTFTNAGEYDVVAVISKAGYNSKTLNAKLVIKKAEIDITDLVFEDLTVTYDGQPKTIEASNIPEGTSVEYEVWNEEKSVKLNISNIVNVGKYKFIAKIKSGDDNYNQTSFKEATLTIEKAKYDMSEVALSDVTKEYDQKGYEASLNDASALPGGVDVSFKYYDSEGNEVASPTNAGVYKIVASFKGDAYNYEAISPIEAKLTITKTLVTLDGVINFNSKTVDFDRESHSLEIEGDLPTGVSVDYENNNQLIAGEYKVIAHFNISNPNQELDINELEAYLIINKITESPQVVDLTTGNKRDFESKDLVLKIDQESGNKRIDIEGFIEDKYEITSISYTNMEGTPIDVNDFSHGVNYNYDITFEFKDEAEKNSVSLTPATGIIKYDITFDSEIMLQDLEVVYDGKVHGLSLNKELPIGTKVEYPNGEEFVNVGTYTIIWNISKATYDSKTLTGTLTITKATHDMSGVLIDDFEIIYDGNACDFVTPTSARYLSAFDNLPKGVTVKEVKSYTKVAGEWTETSFVEAVGEYKIVVSYSYDEENYNQVANTEFIVTIKSE